MSENEEDFSSYLAWQSNYSTTYALFSGFTFVAITMILFEYPSPSQIQAQISLFVLTVMLDVFLFCLYSRRWVLENCVRVAPSVPEKILGRKDKTNYVALFVNEFNWVMLGASVIIMFFVWNLIYLSLATTVVGLMVAIYTYITVTKPWNEFLKTRPPIRR